MSKINDLGENFSKLPKIIEEYENALSDVKEHLIISGKNLEAVNKEQPMWLHYYDYKRIELQTLLKYVEGQVQRVRGRLFKSYTESYQREISDRAKDKYIDNEDAYLNVFGVYLEIKELYEQYCAVVDAFRQRGYSLNNITKIRVANLEDVEI